MHRSREIRALLEKTEIEIKQYLDQLHSNSTIKILDFDYLKNKYNHVLNDNIIFDERFKDKLLTCRELIHSIQLLVENLPKEDIDTRENILEIVKRTPLKMFLARKKEILIQLDR